MLFKFGIYLYSNKDKNNLRDKETKNKEKFAKNYRNKSNEDWPKKCNTALLAIKAVSSWKEIQLDVGIPRSDYTNLKL